MRFIPDPKTAAAPFLFWVALAAGTAAASTGGTGSPLDHLIPSQVGGTAVVVSRSAQAPRITTARCVPAPACPRGWLTAYPGSLLLLRGRNLRPGMRILFPSRPYARISRNSPAGVLARSRLGLVVVVPAQARSGRIVAALRRLRSAPYGPLRIIARPTRRHPAKRKPPAKPKPSQPKHPSGAPVNKVAAEGTPFAGLGMWIWELSRSSGGNLSAIIAQAKAAGITTLFVKSGDGTSYWSQFSPELVGALKAAGLHVCGWQYVYGNQPVAEAETAALAVAHGAECLVIDAEEQYEGRYAAAQRYIETLRSKVGPNYPLGLTSFPYVDLHERFPYSVFLGPGGAQFNLPQIYWRAIGVTVPEGYIHTFEENSIYVRAICPIGQTYENPPAAAIVNFRSLEPVFHGCGGLSFWDWQETTARGWQALSAPLEPNPALPKEYPTSPLLGEGAKGDQVLWLQEHLAAVYPNQPTTGIFEATTTANLKAFQASHGLPQTGQTEPATWQALLALQPVAVDWRGGGPAGG